MAQERPKTTTICDYYSNKTVGANTAENQRILVTLVLHSALLGPFSKYNTVPVDSFTGALTATTFRGQAVDLINYFDGSLESANTGKTTGEAVNFLGSGGVPVLRDLKPSNGNTKSPQQ
ncbi:hypothetical protein NW757_006160 [Fusarium falciforme]|nr:hypothetical protein NW757_006160 [Fusarium falciforme]